MGGTLKRLLCAITFFSAIVSANQQLAADHNLTTTGVNQQTDFTLYNPNSLDRRQLDDPYKCDESNPCKNHACCGKGGWCGYDPDSCGTTGQSPNDKCWSNCDAKAQCGKYAAIPGQTCPLNVCCSKNGFCDVTAEFCGDGCQSNCGQPTPPAGSNGDVQKRIIGYYESWSIGKQCMGMNPKQIPVKSLTHLNYAFAYINPSSFDIEPMPGTDPKTFSQIVDLKAKNNALIVGVSIGGWTFNDNGTDTQPVFHNIVNSPGNRAKFISNVLSFLDHYGFDAVDLDWEYPGASDRGGSGNLSDGKGYVALIQELRRAMDASHRKLELSFTSPTSYWYLRHFPIKEMSEAADYVNFMTYDLHGSWDSDNPIGSRVFAHTNLTEIDLALSLLWRNGVAPEKVNLGLAFYSRTFTLQDTSCDKPGCAFKYAGLKAGCTDTAGIMSYREIEEVLASQNITPSYDVDNAIKYFTFSGDQWASYDDKQTFQQKIKFANTRGLGGLLIWAVDQDTPNLDAMRAVVYPKNLTDDNIGNDVNYWKHKQIGTCETTECGGQCKPGMIEITEVACPKGGKKAKPQKLCCPISSAPDPKKCAWRGGPGLCNGQCHGGEVALASSMDGGNGHCTDGRQFYCCPIPEVADGAGINCGWQDKCNADQELLTFAGTFLEDINPLVRTRGLVGEALADFLDGVDLRAGKRYCCGKKEFKNWKDCYWAGTTGKGLYSCDDNHCATGIEVELTNSFFGNAQTCAPMVGRQRAFCCTPASGKSLFMPVPLEDLFPHPPPSNIAEPAFNLEVDDTWGTGQEKGRDDPDHASFGFVVVTAPDEVHVSLRRRSSPWEVFNCTDTDNEEGQTIQLVCADGDDVTDTRCNDIHKGYGAVGTIVALPDRCGPGQYGVVKSMSIASDQQIPSHIKKRGVAGTTIYDLAFDYDFRRVPRDFGNTQMRVDFSNQEGYWNSVVNRPGQTKLKRDEAESFTRNRKRWLQDEWDRAYHDGSMSPEELHKRWFGSSVVAWLANLVGVGSAEVTKEVHHTVNEDLSIILIDQQFGPCPVGPAMAQGNLRAKLNAHVQVDTSFGLTIIASLTNEGITLQDSYLFFKNKGEVTVAFTLDAIASLSYTSGDVKIIGLDNFPGATFRVPGIVTVGPNMEVFGRVDALLSFAGHLEAKATVASWEVQQTYPQNDQYPEKTLQDPNQQGTDGKDPSISASVNVNGEVQMHIKPQVTFGIVFDSRWKVPDTAARLALDGYVVLYAEAGWGLGDKNDCPISYGVDAGADMYVQLTSPPLFGWGGNQRLPLGSLRRVPVVPRKCIGGQTKRDLLSIGASENATYYGLDSTGLLTSTPASIEQLQYFYDSGLTKRDTFSIGPLITIPAGFLSCPAPAGEAGECAACQASGPLTDGGALHRKRTDGPEESCPYLPPRPPLNSACSDDDLAKRAEGEKTINLPWTSEAIHFSKYPSCGASGAGDVNKWYLPNYAVIGGPRTTCDPAIIKLSRKDEKIGGHKSGQFATDHVFEVHLLSDFIYWLVGKGRTYINGQIDWLDGFTRPDIAWVEDVFGSKLDDSGFGFLAYRGDKIRSNFLVNAAELAFGGSTTTELLAILYTDTNRQKLVWTLNTPRSVSNVGLSNTLQIIQQGASVFDYLNHRDIRPKWQNSGKAMEALCVAFDNAWFADQNADRRKAAPQPGFDRPAEGPGGATNWGLRTIWSYWIEQHLSSIEDGIPLWLTDARTELTRQANIPIGGPSERAIRNARNFMKDYMTGKTGTATPDVMHFPRTDTASVLGSGKTNARVSRYGMWDYDLYGVMGI